MMNNPSTPVRYVLHPGYIRGRFSEYFISGPSLAKLHGLDIKSKDVVFGDTSEYKEQDGDIHLYPRAEDFL